MNNEAFRHLMFYGTIAIGKTMLMSAVTGFYRFKSKSMISEEDAEAMTKNKEKQKQILMPDPMVERVSCGVMFPIICCHIIKL